jgi:flavin-dependent dehydrogenase
MPSMVHAEVLIVGGGPAGAACAGYLRRHGVDCLILDRATFPRLKLCAGWVTPEVFDDLGVKPEAYPHGLRVLEGLRLSVRGIKFRLPSRQYAIRRIEFDDWLLRRAGVTVHHHTVRRVTRLGDRYVVDDAFSSTYLVGAGGTHCPVARTFFDLTNPRSRDALIVTQEEAFAYAAADDRCHLWFFEDGLPGYAWYVPKSGGDVNVGVGGKIAALDARGETIHKHWDLLVERLDRLNLVRGYDFRPRGHAYYLREPGRRLRVGNAFVVGDAAGLATMDMGEGIEPAIKSGLLAARAIVHGEAYRVEDLRATSQPRPIAWLLIKGYG